MDAFTTIFFLFSIAFIITGIYLKWWPNKVLCRKCESPMKRVGHRRYSARNGWRVEEQWVCKSCGYEKTTDVPNLL